MFELDVNPEFMPKHKIKYALAAPKQCNDGNRGVIITIGGKQGIPKAIKFELPEYEAQRLVRLMTTDLW